MAIQSFCQKNRYKERPIYHRVQELRSAECGFCFRGGGIDAMRADYTRWSFLSLPAWRLQPPLYRRKRERKRVREGARDPFVLSSTLRAAESRLAGIADWTTQPRRDAANYPPGVRRRIRSETEKGRVGFPEETDYTRYKSRSHAAHNRALVPISSLSSFITPSSLFLP